MPDPTPPIFDRPPRHLPTGNLDVHVEASPEGPSVSRVGVASLGFNGLLDLVGEPLLEVSGRGWGLSRLSDWVPVWENESLRVTLLAPHGERGLALRVEPLKPGPIQVAGNVERLGLRRLREETLGIAFHPRRDDRSGGYVLEARAERTLLALGLQADAPPSRADWGEQFVLEWDSGPVTLYLALAPEADGACAAAFHLRRVGWEALLRRTLHKLALLTTNYSGPLFEVYRRHLIFAYYFAQADALEGEPVLPASRSPRHPAPGAYSARDALLWLFPALLRADRARAKEVLRAAFSRHARWPGLPAQYLGGPPLHPGFELANAAAYPLALARYLEATGPNPELVAELRGPLERVFARVADERHPSLPLYRTTRSPADDPHAQPYLTYDNALWCVALERLAPFWPSPDALKHEARAVRDTLYRQAERGGRFAFSFEPGGPHAFADDPAGSLLLLPHLGFCNRQDPVWQSTALWALGEDNPRHHRGRFAGEGSAHSPFPSGAGLANRILSGLMRPAGDALAVLEQAALDGGYACESFDPETGLVRGGAGSAALAGFVAYALGGAKDGRHG